MNGWRDIKLKEVSEYVTVGFVGSMADQYVEAGVPFLRSLNIHPFRLNYNDLKYIPESFHDAIKKSKLRPGDVAIVRTGYPGTACVIPADLPDANCSDLVILRPGPDLNPHYIAAVFNSSFGQSLVGGNLVGAAQQHFNVTVAKELKLRLPPRAEQDKIAAVLVGLNDLIAINQRRIALLESMAEEIYREWFVRLRFPGYTVSSFDKGLPKGWSSTPLGQLIGETKRPVKKSDLAGHTRYVGLEHISRKSVALTMHGAPESVESDKLAFFAGDILFSKIRPYLHKVALAHFDGICSTDTLVLSPRRQDFREFALLTVFSETFIEIANTASKGTKMPRADWHFLKQLRVSVPSDPLLARFNTMVKPMLDEIASLIHLNETLAKQRDALLPRLISGKLRVDALDIQFPPSMQPPSEAA
ncbi:hypothetical protein [Stenotrophomonas maltophilia]|uniref:hypothetical protein n=1 Tax=Stenotrophomonas maltophilia TaxID=40324 RepID=UPI0038BFDDFB